MSLATLSTSSLLAAQPAKAQRTEASGLVIGSAEPASNGQFNAKRPYCLMGAYLPQEGISYGARRARLVRRGYA